MSMAGFKLRLWYLCCAACDQQNMARMCIEWLKRIESIVLVYYSVFTHTPTKCWLHNLHVLYPYCRLFYSLSFYILWFWLGNWYKNTLIMYSLLHTLTTMQIMEVYFWLAVHGKPVLFWNGTSGLKFPCFLFMHANGTGPFEFRAVPIL